MRWHKYLGKMCFGGATDGYQFTNTFFAFAPARQASRGGWSALEAGAHPSECPASQALLMATQRARHSA